MSQLVLLNYFIKGQQLRSMKVDEDFNVDTDEKQLKTDIQVVFPVKDAATIYKLHTHYCQVNTAHIKFCFNSYEIFSN